MIIRNLNRIKEVLERQGRSQVWLAKQLKKSYPVVTNYCNNNAQPSLYILNEIADILEVDIKELLNSTKLA